MSEIGKIINIPQPNPITLENTTKIEVLEYFTDIEKGYKMIKHGQKPAELNNIMNNLCRVRNTYEIMIDFKYFKLVAKPDFYDTIIKYLVATIKYVLHTQHRAVLHINLKSMSLTDIDKYRTFISQISYEQNILPSINSINIYNTGSIFATLINVVLGFLDKNTKQVLNSVLKIVA